MAGSRWREWNGQFRDDLRTQQNEYETICRDAANRLMELGTIPDPIGQGKKSYISCL